MMSDVCLLFEISELSFGFTLFTCSPVVLSSFLLLLLAHSPAYFIPSSPFAHLLLLVLVLVHCLVCFILSFCSFCLLVVLVLAYSHVYFILSLCSFCLFVLVLAYSLVYFILSLFSFCLLVVWFWLTLMSALFCPFVLSVFLLF